MMLDVWQHLHSDLTAGVQPDQETWAVDLGGQQILLPIRRLPEAGRAVCSLILNQASFQVLDALADIVAAKLQPYAPEVIVAVPTLGLPLAEAVARRLGHSRLVPLGYSRKFWYDDALSEPVTSITSPGTGKSLRLDPNLLPLIKGRRVALVDDAISTGATAVAAVRLLQAAGAEIAGMVVAMKQSNRWEKPVDALATPLVVRAVYGCPLFKLSDEGWWPIVETQPAIP